MDGKKSVLCLYCWHTLPAFSILLEKERIHPKRDQAGYSGHLSCAATQQAPIPACWAHTVHFAGRSAKLTGSVCFLLPADMPLIASAGQVGEKDDQHWYMVSHGDGRGMAKALKWKQNGLVPKPPSMPMFFPAGPQAWCGGPVLQPSSFALEMLIGSMLEMRLENWTWTFCFN